MEEPKDYLRISCQLSSWSDRRSQPAPKKCVLIFIKGSSALASFYSLQGLFNTVQVFALILSTIGILALSLLLFTLTHPSLSPGRRTKSWGQMAEVISRDHVSDIHIFLTIYSFTMASDQIYWLSILPRHWSNPFSSF